MGVVYMGGGGGGGTLQRRYGGGGGEERYLREREACQHRGRIVLLESSTVT